MKTYTFRVIIDTEEDIFRDIVILENQDFEELHQAIIKAFEFKGDQMASFYMSNEEWEKGEEISLMDMSLEDDKGPVKMKDILIGSRINNSHHKILYVYDFLMMWIFYIELVKEGTQEPDKSYPFISLIFSDPPDESSKEITDLFNIPMKDSTEKDINEIFDDNEENGISEFDNLEDYDI